MYLWLWFFRLWQKFLERRQLGECFQILFITDRVSLIGIKLNRFFQRRHGLIDPAEARRLMDEHFSLARDNRKELWNLMVFQLWHARWMR